MRQTQKLTIDWLPYPENRPKPRRTYLVLHENYRWTEQFSTDGGGFISFHTGQKCSVKYFAEVPLPNYEKED